MSSLEAPAKPSSPARSSPRGRPSATNPPPPDAPQKRYVCSWVFSDGRPQCQSSFDRKSDLKRHQCIHSGRKDYRCRRCGKAFVQSSALHVHERTHTGERPHICEQCIKAFADSSSLARHRKTHDPDREVGRRSKKKRPQSSDGTKAEPVDDDAGDPHPEASASNGPMNHGMLPVEGDQGHRQMDLADRDIKLETEGIRGMFVPQPGIDVQDPNAVGSSGMDYDPASAMPISTPTDPGYSQEAPATSSYPNMMNTSVPSTFDSQSPMTSQSLDARRLSGHVEQPPQDIDIYQMVQNTASMSNRDKREFLSNLSMYNGQFEDLRMPPSSRPGHWPNLETQIQQPPQSQQTSPSTATSEALPTPTDYPQPLPGPKGSMTSAPPEHYMPPSMNDMEPPHSQPAPQPVAAPPAPPPQQQQQQQQQQPPHSFMQYQLPTQAQWQHPDPASLMPQHHHHMDPVYPEGDYAPIEVAPAPIMDQFGWLNGIGSYGLLDEDKTIETFGEQMPSQAFEQL